MAGKRFWLVLNTMLNGISSRSPFLANALVGCALFALSLAVLWFYYGAAREVYGSGALNDFYKFYLSSRNVLTGGQSYWMPPDKARKCQNQSLPQPAMGGDHGPRAPMRIEEIIHPNLNPPTMVMLVMPLAYLSYEDAWILFCMVSLACAGLAWWQVLKSRAFPGLSSSRRAILAVLVFLAYFPSYANFEYGQVAFLLMLPMTLSWFALRMGKDRLSGLYLGLLVGLKPFFVFFFLPILCAGRWSVLVSALAGLVIAVSCSGGLLGFQHYSDYLAVLGKVSWFSSSWNASFFGFYTKLFGGAEGNAWFDAPVLSSCLIFLSSMMVVLVVARLVWRARLLGVSRPELADRLFLLSTPSMLLLSPLGWMYYFPLLAVPVLIFIRCISQSPHRRIYGLLLILSLMLSGVPSFLISSCAIKTLGDVLWRHSLPFYSLVGFFVLAVAVSYGGFQAEGSRSLTNVSRQSMKRG